MAQILVLGLSSCGGGGQPKDPPPKKPVETAPVGTPSETVSLKLGNRRALIYTWRGRFPRELQDDVEWILSQDEYVKTDDFADTWKVIYCTKDGSRFLQVAACEYVSAQAAKESYESFVSRIEGATPAAAPEKCERATAGKVGDHALAAVLSSRYLFIFDKPRGSAVGEGVVKAFVTACFTEPRGE